MPCSCPVPLPPVTPESAIHLATRIRIRIRFCIRILVNAFAKEIALALLQRLQPERIVVGAELAMNGYFDLHRRRWHTLPVASIKALSIGFVALHAKRLLDVHRIELVNAGLCPLDAVIIRRACAVQTYLVLMLRAGERKKERGKEREGEIEKERVNDRAGRRKLCVGVLRPDNSMFSATFCGNFN